jgi:restriction endonuclease S subunit
MVESDVKLYDIIKDRLDAYYYNPKFKIISQKLSKIGHTTIRKECIKIFSGITPTSGGNAYSNKLEGIPFIRSGDFSEDNLINFSEVNYIKSEIHNKLMKSSQLYQSDILIAIVGATIGKVGVYNYALEANINQAICAVRFKNNINPFFVQIFLLTSLGQTILDRLKRPVARANINLEEIASIPIPILTIKYQQQIVDLYNNAVREKQAKEQEAKALLGSIDDYLLKELGIEMPENVSNERYFKVNVMDLIGGQLDVKSARFKTHKRKSNIYPETILTNIATINKGKSITKDKIIAGDYPVIAGGQTSPYSHSEYNEIENSITISASGAYSGFVWFHNYKIFASDCSVVRSIDETKYLTQYLYSILKLKQDEIYKMQKGAGQPHVYPNDIAAITIPAVNIDKQIEIVEYIQSIQTNAKQLQQEAMKVLEEAKREVEGMIEGKLNI